MCLQASVDLHQSLLYRINNYNRNLGFNLNMRAY